MDGQSISGILRLLVLVIAGFILTQIATLGLAYAYGYDFEALKELGGDFTTKAPVGLIKYSLLASHLFIFIFPSLLFIQLTYKSDKWKFLMLDKKIDGRLLAVAALFLVACYPAVSFSYTVNSWIPLPEWMHTQEDASAETIQRILQMNGIIPLLFNLFLIALIPAIGEELLFRGLFQNLIERGTKRAHVAVWIAASLFSLIHFQFEGFLPRLFLGAILGYSFLWTRSLWVPMILHFLNNALPILSLYLIGDDLSASDPSSSEAIPLYLVVASLIAGAAIAYYFMKNRVKHEFT